MRKDTNAKALYKKYFYVMFFVAYEFVKEVLFCQKSLMQKNLWSSLFADVQSLTILKIEIKKKQIIYEL